jgi:hypothetical protein
MMVGVALWVYETLVVRSVPALCSSTVHGCVKLERPPSRRFEFQKRSQRFIRTHNEALSIVAMRVQIVGPQESIAEA